ncbi:hypothetical protein EHQ53_04915 [Leptospira langatensis]|uniref:Uncharacterized protein n=1 Tax=Leptospira langatensis TaxID=2484983 RepID=A0A5F1ZYH6_9LEPT|nr:hypothetical protein [Leptospira langatensis]TGK00157.1 hypothetical protein EHO57_12775 [Leptospira langatensis]TGL42792.1 hypothetical protein EHQ53_04915 [Leptospira langatensis]
MTHHYKKHKKSSVSAKKKSSRPSSLFLVLVGIPFCIFLVSAMLGSVLRLDRISSESAFENRLNPIERVWRGLKLKVYAYEYGPDYRNKIPENEARSIGLFRESILESLLPRYLFLFLAIAFPCYFIVRLLREKPIPKSQAWPIASSSGKKKIAYSNPKKIAK